MKPFLAAYRLALVTALITYGLIVWGGVVHNTGSSLACPDWPLCQDQWFPSMHGGVLFEHGHRLLAALVVLGIIGLNALLWRAEPARPAWQRLKLVLLALILMAGIVGGIMVSPALSGAAARGVLRGALTGLGLVALFCLLWSPRATLPNASLKSLGLLALVFLQALLGGATVKYRLPTLVSTAHLATSMIVLITLVYLCRATWVRARGTAQAQAQAASPLGARAAFSILLVTCAVLFLQIVLGALVRHTASSEAAGWGLANSFVGTDPTTGHYALWPVDERAQLNMFHRYLAIVAGLMVILCCARCWALLGETFTRGRGLVVWGPAALVCAQILAGILMLATWNVIIYPGLGASDQVADVIQITMRSVHLALGALVLVSLFYFSVVAGEAGRMVVVQAAPAGDRAGGQASLQPS